MKLNDLQTRLYNLFSYTCSDKKAHEYSNLFAEFFGNDISMFNTETNILSKQLGVSENISTLVRLIPDISRVYELSKYSGQLYFNSHQDWVKFFSANFLGRNTERILIAGVDDKNKLVGFDIVSFGEDKSAILSVDKVLKFISAFKPHSVALAHNHPNGLEKPSIQDFHATKRIQKILNNSNVNFVEHFVIVGKKFECILGYFNKNME